MEPRAGKNDALIKIGGVTHRKRITSLWEIESSSMSTLRLRLKSGPVKPVLL